METLEKERVMVDLVVAGFLVAHGLIHPAIYAVPKDPDEDPPFHPDHSWALAAAHVEAAPMRAWSIASSWVVGALFVAAGVAILIGAPWTAVALAAGASGLALKILYFHPWLIVGVALDLVVIYAASVGWPASLA